MIVGILAMILGLAGIYFGKKMKKWAEDQQATQLKRQKEESKKEQEG